MPTRNLVYEALVLRSRETPSGDRIAVLLTAEAGLVEAFVFGGPKSKLRSLASPFVSGRAFVYLDPSKDFRKLADFEVREAFSGLRESLRKLMAAGLIAELLLKTSGGGGDYPEVLALARESLRSLEDFPEEAADYPLVLFLWRLLSLLGLLPDPDSCVRCETPLALNSSRRYSPRDSGFLCPRCASSEAGWAAEEAGNPASAYRGPSSIDISAGATRWLARASGLPFRTALDARLDRESLQSLKALCFDLARRAAEAPLAALAAGAGIL